MQASPPDDIEKRALVSEATRPASTSPRRGPLVTTSENTDDIRPRIASGVTVWLMTERQTGLTLPRAPPRATGTSAPAAQSEPARPAAAIATPQTQTAATVIRPSLLAEP